MSLTQLLPGSGMAKLYLCSLYLETIHFTPVPVSVFQVQQPSGIFLHGPFSEVQNSSKS